MKIAEYDSLIKTVVQEATAKAPEGSCEVRLMILGLPFCPERVFKGSTRCFWHAEDLGKYEQASIDEYFGVGYTLAQTLEDAVKRRVYLQGAILRDAKIGGDFLRPGPTLAGAYLPSADLRGAHLSYTDLSGAVLVGADLRRAKLGDCKLKGAKLSFAKLAQAKLRSNSLDGVIGLTRQSFRQKRGVFREDRILEEYPDQAEPMYRELTRYFSSQGLYDDASWSAYRASVMRHRQLSKRPSIQDLTITALLSEHAGFGAPSGSDRIEWVVARWDWLKSAVLLVVMGYGEKPGRVILSSVALIFLFAGVYCLPGSRTASDFGSSLYFSMITFSTVGYGDIAPSHIYRFVAGFEALVGILMTGLFLFCLGRRSVFR